jgi:hypothetical protein
MTNEDLIFQEEMPAIDKLTKSEIKKSITVKTGSGSTHIIVLATHPLRGKLGSIVFKEKSTPIGGYTYDAKLGKYYVEFVNYIDLGTIPISFFVQVDRIKKWECRIPVREFVIQKYLDKDQKRKLESFKQANKDCEFEFMQLASCY